MVFIIDMFPCSMVILCSKVNQVPVCKISNIINVTTGSRYIWDYLIYCLRDYTDHSKIHYLSYRQEQTLSVDVFMFY